MIGTPRVTPAGDEVVLTLAGETEFHALREELELLLAGDERLRSSTTLVLDLGRRHLSQEQLVQLEEVVSRQLGPRLLHVVSEEVAAGAAGPPGAGGRDLAPDDAVPRDPRVEGRVSAGETVDRFSQDGGAVDPWSGRRNGVRAATAAERIQQQPRSASPRHRRAGRPAAPAKSPSPPSGSRGRASAQGYGGHSSRGLVASGRGTAKEDLAQPTAPAATLSALGPGAYSPSHDTARRSGSVLVRNTLRAGHRLVYDGDVVIIGDVNPGAEVIASGDVVVFGRLRGIVHAGVRGDEGAMVASLVMQPVQLRIAGAIARAPDGEPGTINRGAGRVPKWGTEPEVAYLRQGRVVIEPFDPVRWHGLKNRSRSRSEVVGTAMGAGGPVH